MDVKLPKLGEGAESGVVVSILVKEGESVTEGQTLLELENEKAVAPIPASAAGVVSRIHVKEGDRISVGATLVTLGEKTASAESPGAAAPAEPASRPAEPARASAGSDQAVAVLEAVPAKSDAPIAAPPGIRRLARDLGIDLARVRGTERGGRIGMEDLRNYVQLVQRLAFQRPEGATTQKAAQKAAPAEPIDFAKWGPVRHQPFTPLRQTIARRMSESWHATPRVTQFDEADITRLNELRKSHAPAYEKAGARLTLTPLIFKALAGTLKKHPVLNSSLDEAAGHLVLKDYIHIGLAVDTEAGLMVPVIRDVDQKSVLDLSREIEALAAKARERKVAREELRGGTFTVSNQGGIGGGPFTPIVNLPEVAILGLGRGALKPAVWEGQIAPRLLLPLALSYDHRVIDGAVAARFIVDLVQALQAFPEEAVRL
jgi:pyruvate dehydrogenase E2 component (dihydrolipoamide acetyltransferase)